MGKVTIKWNEKLIFLHSHSIPNIIQSFPIPAIRQRHYKNKRKPIKIKLEDDKKSNQYKY